MTLGYRSDWSLGQSLGGWAGGRCCARASERSCLTDHESGHRSGSSSCGGGRRGHGHLLWQEGISEVATGNRYRRLGRSHPREAGQERPTGAWPEVGEATGVKAGARARARAGRGQGAARG